MLCRKECGGVQQGEVQVCGGVGGKAEEPLALAYGCGKLLAGSQLVVRIVSQAGRCLQCIMEWES